MAGQLKGQNVWPRWGGVAYGRLWGGADPRWGEATPPDDVTPRGEQHAAATCGRKEGGGEGKPRPHRRPPLSAPPPPAPSGRDRFGSMGAERRWEEGRGEDGANTASPPPPPH